MHRPLISYFIGVYGHFQQMTTKLSMGRQDHGYNEAETVEIPIVHG
jgi:hypothetical protein